MAASSTQVGKWYARVGGLIVALLTTTAAADDPKDPCAAACPSDAIFVEAAENTDEARFSPGERYASTYEINMLRCIFCGYCEDACPTEAIILGDNYELSFTTRGEAIYTKDMLIEPVPAGGQATPQKTQPGQFERSVPPMKDAID